MRPNILSIDQLAIEIEKLRAQGKRVVHCHGVFDLIHIGHVRHFQEARKFGDVLVVTLTPDRFVNKGPNRPAFPEDLRAEMLASIGAVDYVAINLWPSAVETINTLRPDVFVKGNEFKDLVDTIGHVDKEEDAVRSVGGTMAFTEDVTFSSSGLINKFLSPFSDAVAEYLGDFSLRFSSDEVLQPLRDSQNKRVLLLGETIIDEYRYCTAIGKSGKEPVLAAKFESIDKFAGGVIACANHVASFCDHVDVVSFIGEDGIDEPFIQDHLRPSVNATLLRKPDSPTITKIRFVEKYLSQKLFEIYDMNDEPLSAELDQWFCSMLESSLPQYDMVIVADYGHGMLSRRAIQTICDHAKFLAVNTQSNAGNHGFNLISKYPRADFISLAEREFALETRDLQMSAREMALHVSRKLSCPRIILTRGKNGCLSYSAGEGFAQVPAFATDVVDRVGAGDAVLSATALAALSGAAAEPLGFLGNVVGAEAVKIMGNKRAIERKPLFRHVECLLKVHEAPPKAKPKVKLGVAA